MEPPKEPVSGGGLHLVAPKPGVTKGAPSTAKPAPARASPRTRAKAPPAKKAAQRPQKPSDTVDVAAGKEQQRPRVDGAATCSASQPLQPLTGAGETPSLSCPIDGAGEQLTQPQLPVMEPAELKSLPPASTLIPPESPLEEPVAKRAKPATPEAAFPPAASGLCPKKSQEPGKQHQQPAVSPASDNTLRQGQLIEGPKDLPLCGDQGETADPLSSRSLFNPLLFKTLLQKAKATAGIEEDPAASDPALFDPNILLFSEPTIVKEEIPCPKFFMEIIQRQWEKPTYFMNPGVNERRYYNMDLDLMEALKIPTVDGPVAALVSPTNPSSLTVNNLTPEENRIETMLRKFNVAAAWVVRSAVAASFFNRTSLLWLKEMQARIPATDCQTHEDINNLIAAAEFSADATLNSATYASRAIGCSVAARRLLWLRHWRSDMNLKWKLASSPFKGDKLFGEALEPLLVETKDKKKVLPSMSKPTNPKSSSNFKKPPFRRADSAHNFSQPQKKAYFQRPDRQSDRAGYGDRSRQQFQSKRPFRGNGGQPFRGSSRDLHSQSSQIQPSRRPPATGDYSPKGFKEAERDSRLKNTQQASGTQEIQKPVPQIHTGQYPGGRLPEVNRSHGNIPTRPYIADSPTVSMDVLHDMPVQSSHKDTSNVLCTPQDYPYSRPTLSGRHVDRILPPPGHSGPPHHDQSPSWSFRESGVHSEPRQEPLASYQPNALPSSIHKDDIMRSLPVPGPPAQHQPSGEPPTIGPTVASRPRLTIVKQDGVLRLHLSRPTSAYPDPDGRRPVVVRGLRNQFQLARAQSMSHSTPTDPDPHLQPPYTDPIMQHSHQDPYEPPREQQPLQDVDYRTQDPPVVDVIQYNQGKHIEETELSHYRSGGRLSRLESPDRDPEGRRPVDRRGTMQERQPDTDYRRPSPVTSAPGADVTDRNQGKHIQETESPRHRSGRRFSQLGSPDRDRDGRRPADRRGMLKERQPARDRSRSRSPRKDRGPHRRSPHTDPSRKRRH